MTSNQQNKTPGNNPPNTQDPNKKRPQFNIYWIWGILFISLIVYNYFRQVNSAGVETDQLKFYEMLKQGDVEQIQTVRNRKIVRVFVNKDSLQKIGRAHV